MSIKDRPTDGDDYAIGSLALGKHLSEAWSAEVLLNGTKLQGDLNLPAADLTAWGGSLDLLRVFNRSGRFSPYIGVGAGAIEYDVRPGALGADAMWQASLGAFWTLWEGDGSRFALRPDFKARWDDAHSAGETDRLHRPARIPVHVGWNEACRRGAAASATAAAAATTPAPPPPPVPPAPPGDEDHDGVTDDRDRCPGTPAGVAVDANGCPQKGSITLEGCYLRVQLGQSAGGFAQHPR